VLHGRGELGLMSDEYGALTMVLLRFLAFPAQGAPAPRAAPLRAPAPPAISVSPAANLASAARPAVPLPVSPPAQAPRARAVQQAAAAPLVQVAVQAHEPEPAPIDSALGERWNDCVKALVEQGAVAALVRELAQQAGLQRIDDRTTPLRWHLRVAREPLRNPALADKLAAALSVWLGQAVVLEVEAGQPADTPALRDAAERQRRQAAAEALIQADPVVRDLMLQFKTARIVPGSIKPV